MMNIKEFQQLTSQIKDVLISHKYLNKLIQKFQFYLIRNDQNINIDIQNRKSESKVIIINDIELIIDQKKYSYFIIIYDNTIIFTPILTILTKIIDNFYESTIFTSIKEDNSSFLQNIYKYKDSEKEFFSEIIYNFSNSIQQIKLKGDKEVIQNFLKILPSFCSYFIYKSYQNHKNNNQIKINPKKLDSREFIELKQFGFGQSVAKLIFHIEAEELLIAKIFYTPFFESEYSITKYFKRENENTKYFKREYENYTLLNFQSIPHFYGKTKIDGYECLIIEYIRGETLNNIKCDELSDEDRFFIIIQLLAIFEYLHSQGFVYRDLKPSNISIDKNKKVFLFDFNQMINLNKIDENTQITMDFNINNPFACPELTSNQKNTKNQVKMDIYSISLIIFYLFFNNLPNKTNGEKYSFNEFNQNHPKINEICERCVEIDPEKRPNIDELFIFFNNYSLDIYSKQHSVKSIERLIKYYSSLTKEYYSLSLFFLGNIYCDGKYIEKDINKAIQYYKLAADQNPIAQTTLGAIYDMGNLIKRDIKKAIHYFKLASKQNYVMAQRYLGSLYHREGYINKAIHYLELAADQNDPESQMMLGCIYLDTNCEYIGRNINKAIHYFTLSANQNNAIAQTYLGNIYMYSKDIERNINKAIYYYKLAADQNYSYSQRELGLIYMNDEYRMQDISKAIHYLSRSAGQNDLDSQKQLGIIYMDDEYKFKDISKAIYYLSLAAKQNDPIAQARLGIIYYRELKNIDAAIYYFELAANQNIKSAQNYLGIIYYEGKYVKRDINKAIYYLNLSADQNAQFLLAFIYYEGKYVKKDIKTAIFYFTISANQNHPISQFNLGYFYLNGINIPKDINKGCYYLHLAAEQNINEARFLLGIVYSKGNKIEKNIAKSIYYYKYASSLNHPKAKNNLAMIYLNGIGVEKNKIYAIELLKEAVNLNDPLSMFNLAHLYYYEDYKPENLPKIINLLAMSSLHNCFSTPVLLLCIIFMKDKINSIDNIKKEIKNANKSIRNDQLNKLTSNIYSLIRLFNPVLQQIMGSSIIKSISYIYDCDYSIVETRTLIINNNKKQQKTNSFKNIDKDFYDGFGIII